jgi:antitoxin PrlF
MTFRKEVIMNDRKLLRMQEKGQVTIPTEIRKKLGLKQGDLVAVMETPDGVFITPQQVVATKALASIGDILKEQGISLDELIASGREIRTDLIQETYGITRNLWYHRNPQGASFSITASCMLQHFLQQARHGG